jgi:hypothetical protein
MELKELHELDKKLKTLKTFTKYDKQMAQKKLLNIISEVPEHHDTRFQNGFDDIKLKNKAENMGNIHIPNTNIQFINYSVCSKCGHVFSFKDISDYYLNPKSDPFFKTKARQFREDTRVFCYECEIYFLPALIINFLDLLMERRKALKTIRNRILGTVSKGRQKTLVRVK